MKKRIEGIVLWFNNAKGYGFLKDNHDKLGDIFVHYSEIQGDGYKFLTYDDKVTFELKTDERGRVSAQNVIKE